MQVSRKSKNLKNSYHKVKGAYMMNRFFLIFRLLFIKPFYYIMWLSSLAIRILFKSPIFLLFYGITIALTTWIYGQVVALITTHSILPMSYFDISQYPITVQEAFNEKFSFHAMCNWYILPLIVLGLFEFVFFFKVVFLPDEQK